jgi:hypothetical protein
MAIYTYDSQPNWKKDKDGIKKKEKQVCSRCNNNVQYELVWDAEGVGFAGIQLINFKKYYAFKCPICPNIEPLTNEIVYAIKRSK